MSNMVLLVEDELFVALDIQAIIERAGLSVRGPFVTVEDTLAAINDLGSSQPICAVLDVRLEDGEVFPAADKLRDAGVPLLFHSGHADNAELKVRYPEARVCAKPCSPAVLTRNLLELAKVA